MRFYRSASNAWRRFARWISNGDGASTPDRGTDSGAAAQNESFLADLDEARRRAVLSAICAPRRRVAPD